MATKPEKQKLPAYLSYTSFIKFINGLRETSIPQKVDRSVMPKASGSQVSATFAALKFLGLIGEDDRPTDRMQKLVHAPDEERSPILAETLKDCYSFLFDDETFNIEKATTNQVVEKFRGRDISGSTVTKSVAFFLSMATAAGVKVSPHVKAPPAPKSTVKRTPRTPSNADGADDFDDAAFEEEDDTTVQKFEIPIPGKQSVKVIVPSDLDADDWEMLQSMITVYVKRWKGFTGKPVIAPNATSNEPKLP